MKRILQALLRWSCWRRVNQFRPTGLVESRNQIDEGHGNVYMLQGSGGNIGVSVGADGILIVDDQYAPLADKIKAALRRSAKAN